MYERCVKIDSFILYAELVKIITCDCLDHAFLHQIGCTELFYLYIFNPTQRKSSLCSVDKSLISTDFEELT